MMLVSRRPETRQKRKPVKMSVFLTLDMLGGPRATIDDLKRELGKLRRSEVVRIISTLSQGLMNARGEDAPHQWQLARELLTTELLSGLEKWLRENPDWNWGIFHRRQMAFLLQMGVGACSEETSDGDTQATGRTFGLACLMANALIFEAEPQQASDRWKSDFHGCFVPSTIRVLEYAPHWEISARAQMLWFEMPKRPCIEKRFRECKVEDFGSTFEKKHGMPLELLFAVTSGLWASYFNQAHQTGSPLLVNRQWLDSQFPQGGACLAMSLLSRTGDELAAQVAEKRWQDCATDFSGLMAKPIMELLPGRFACPDVGNLLRFVTEQFYVLLREAYNDEPFPQLFGYVFEEYVNAFIREFGIESDRFRTFWPSPKFRGSNDHVCDGLLHNHDVLRKQNVALVAEYKHRVLRPHEKYAGDFDVTWRGIEDIIGRRDKWKKAKQKKGKKKYKKGIYQLACSIGRLLKGETAAIGQSTFRLTEDTKVLPALVAYEDCLSLNSIRRRADERMREALEDEGVDPKRVGPLLIFTTHDIERIEALHRKVDWVTTVNGFAEFLVEHMDDPMATFDIYSVKKKLPSEDPQTSLLWRLFSRSLEHAARHASDPAQGLLDDAMAVKS